MFHIERVLVLGGDLRCAYLAKELARTGFHVTTYGFDSIDFLPSHTAENLEQAVRQAKIIILPLPVSKDHETINTPLFSKEIPIQTVLDLVNENQIVFGGMFTRDIYKAVKDRGIKIFDYFEREELAVLNAVPTVEGAIELAMHELPVTLWGAECLITGYGRIAKVLQKTLLGMGAHVTVAARKYSDRAWVNAFGSESISIKGMEEQAERFDVIFNTVPHAVIDKTVLHRVKKDVLIIDLASVPGGVDFEEAKKMHLNVKWALSIPGKVAPKTAGQIIQSTILNILEEESLCLI